MRGSTMTRSAYGLGGAPDESRRLGVCSQRDRNPDHWITTAGNLSRDNLEARRLCNEVCRIRVACRDEMLNPRTPRPCQEIRAGWHWKSKGAPTPVPGEEHLVPRAAGPVPAVEGKPRQPRGRKPSVAVAGRFLAAGRERLAGVHPEEVARKYGVTRRTVNMAAQLVRDVPELVPDVEAARMPIAAAMLVARERRAAS